MGSSRVGGGETARWGAIVGGGSTGGGGVTQS